MDVPVVHRAAIRLAWLYPEPEKGGRGKNGKASEKRTLHAHSGFADGPEVCQSAQGGFDPGINIHATTAHPRVAHYYLVHSYDYPALAQKGLDAALRYAKVAEAAPHAQHMPSRIFTRVGYLHPKTVTFLTGAKSDFSMAPTRRASVLLEPCAVISCASLGR